MLEPDIWLDLDASCGICQQPFSLTVLCQGPGLSNRLGANVQTAAACPHCGETNAILFDTLGNVIEVVEENRIGKISSAARN